MVDRIMTGLEAPSVCLDNYAAGRIAALHFMNAGHRKIGCLRGEPESFVGTERLRGFTTALKQFGLSVDKEIIRGIGCSRESGVEGARFILDSSRRPSTIITLGSQGILGLLDVLSEMLDLLLDEGRVGINHLIT